MSERSRPRKTDAKAPAKRPRTTTTGKASARPSRTSSGRSGERQGQERGPTRSSVDPDLLAIAGERPRDRQTAFVSESEVDTLGELTDTDVYQGELEAGVHDDLPTEPDERNIEMVTARELRSGETSNPDVAAEEGLVYVPPIDPPVVPSEDSREGLKVAAGFGVSALDEEYDEDHSGSALATEDEMSARIREALRADSSTTEFADHLAIGTRGGVVRVRGLVDDVDDSDNVLAVIERVEGVVEVIDELEVRALA
jgi:hypothetical protein